MSTAEWTELGRRLQRRIIRALDVISILLLDSVIIVVGWSFVRLWSLLPRTESIHLEAAKKLSDWVFLIMYLSWVTIDIVEFYYHILRGAVSTTEMVEVATGGSR